MPKPRELSDFISSVQYENPVSKLSCPLTVWVFIFYQDLFTDDLSDFTVQERAVLARVLERPEPDRAEVKRMIQERLALLYLMFLCMLMVCYVREKNLPPPEQRLSLNNVRTPFRHYQSRLYLDAIITRLNVSAVDEVPKLGILDPSSDGPSGHSTKPMTPMDHINRQLNPSVPQASFGQGMPPQFAMSNSFTSVSQMSMNPMLPTPHQPRAGELYINPVRRQAADNAAPQRRTQIKSETSTFSMLPQPQAGPSYSAAYPQPAGRMGYSTAAAPSVAPRHVVSQRPVHVKSEESTFSMPPPPQAGPSYSGARRQPVGRSALDIPMQVKPEPLPTALPAGPSRLVHPSHAPAVHPIVHSTTPLPNQKPLARPVTPIQGPSKQIEHSSFASKKFNDASRTPTPTTTARNPPLASRVHDRVPLSTATNPVNIPSFPGYPTPPSPAQRPDSQNQRPVSLENSVTSPASANVSKAATAHVGSPPPVAGVKRRLGMGRTTGGYANKKFKPPV